VAKERLKSPRARLFVALDLPESVLEGLAAWQRTELTDEALRPSRSETLHMTLAFLGYQPERAIDQIAEAAMGFEADAPLVHLLGDPVAVPRNRPRLYAIDSESDETVALQAEVERRLVEARFYEPEKRPFWPHLTVARVRSERPSGDDRRRRRRGPPMRVERPPGRLPEALLDPFRGVRITLYRSYLRPTGAEYERVARLELPPRSGGGKVT
jgi:RNA 2',3'-cyclic 3'-phosphodiesterase